MDEYTQLLEMELMFAEGETQDRERIAYESGENDGYNQALEDLLSKVKSNHYLLSDKINSTDYGMFTIGIEQAIDELKR